LNRQDIPKIVTWKLLNENKSKCRLSLCIPSSIQYPTSPPWCAIIRNWKRGRINHQVHTVMYLKNVYAKVLEYVLKHYIKNGKEVIKYLTN
jgi:hypothetical protein